MKHNRPQNNHHYQNRNNNINYYNNNNNNNNQNFDNTPSNTWDNSTDDELRHGKRIGQPPLQMPIQASRISLFQGTEKFEDMKIKDNLLRGLVTYGFVVPSKIQQKCIPVISDRKDIVAQSQAGTGKTGAFTCGVLQVIDEKKNFPQAIILSPTRELSAQIESVVLDIGRYLKISTSLCIGGDPIDNNIKKCRTAHVIIGTPGRINDLIERRNPPIFDMANITIIVLDEADVLLSREFLGQTRNIVTKLSEDAQICAFSATLPPAVVALTGKMMNNPEYIPIEEDQLTLDQITQYYVDVSEDRHKYATLDDLYGVISINQCIIYVNYKERAKNLCKRLTENNYNVETIHSDLTPLERTNIMHKFRAGVCRILVSTDLLARGIDVQQVGYVINYDLPNENDTDSYLHRIGRSGRYGKQGIAINFVTKRDRHILDVLRSKFGVMINPLPSDPRQINAVFTNDI